MIAIEPDPVALSRLKKNISANNVDINAYNQHLHSVITQGVQDTQAGQTALYNAMEGGKSGGFPGGDGGRGGDRRRRSRSRDRNDRRKRSRSPRGRDQRSGRY